MPETDEFNAELRRVIHKKVNTGESLVEPFHKGLDEAEAHFPCAVRTTSLDLLVHRAKN